jgi:hypothetical protein
VEVVHDLAGSRSKTMHTTNVFTNVCAVSLYVIVAVGYVVPLINVA